MSLIIFSSGVVDYKFLLSSSQTLSDLDQSARQAAAGLVPFMRATCLSDVKRLICANVYLECAPNGLNKLLMN